MIDHKLPLELDDGRTVELEAVHGGYINIYVTGAVMRPSYTYDEAEEDGRDDDYEYYSENHGRELWSYNRTTGIFDGGNAHGFFVLRNSYSNAEPDETEGFFV